MYLRLTAYHEFDGGIARLAYILDFYMLCLVLTEDSESILRMHKDILSFFWNKDLTYCKES